MEVRAHVEDDANFAMPESAHTGGGHHTRATRPGAAPASRPSGGARQGAGGAQEAGLGA